MTEQETTGAPGYAERDQDETTEQTGGGVDPAESATSDQNAPDEGGGAPTTDEGMDAGGRAHTGLDEPHPAGDGPRSDRDVGGPTAA